MRAPRALERCGKNSSQLRLPTAAWPVRFAGASLRALAGGSDCGSQVGRRAAVITRHGRSSTVGNLPPQAPGGHLADGSEQRANTARPRVPGRHARGGLTRFAPPVITSRRRGATTRHPGYSGHRRPAAPGRNRTAASVGELRGDHRDDLAGRDQVPVPGAPYSFQGDTNYAVASSPAPTRSARTSPMVRSRLAESGSGRCAWIW